MTNHEPTTEQVYNDAIDWIRFTPRLTPAEQMAVMFRLYYDTTAAINYLKEATGDSYDLTPIRDELLPIDDPTAYTTLLGNYFMERIMSTDLSAADYAYAPRLEDFEDQVRELWHNRKLRRWKLPRNAGTR